MIKHRKNSKKITNRTKTTVLLTKGTRMVSKANNQMKIAKPATSQRPQWLHPQNQSWWTKPLYSLPDPMMIQAKRKNAATAKASESSMILKQARRVLKRRSAHIISLDSVPLSCESTTWRNACTTDSRDVARIFIREPPKLHVARHGNIESISMISRLARPRRRSSEGCTDIWIMEMSTLRGQRRQKMKRPKKNLKVIQTT